MMTALGAPLPPDAAETERMPPPGDGSRSAISLAWGLVRYQRRAVNRSKLLAEMWDLLDPLVTMLVYWFLLVKVLDRQNPFNDNYAVFLFLSITLHRFATASMNRGASALIRNQALVMAGAVPKKRAVVYASTMDLMMTAGLSLAVFFVTCIAIGVVGDTWPIRVGVSWILLIPLSAALLIFSLGCGFLLSCVTVYWRDLQNMLSMLTRMLFILSPVLYDAGRVGAPGELGYTIFMANPLAGFYEAFRYIIIKGEFPALLPTVWAVGVSCVMFAVGWVIFHRLEGRACRYW